MTGNKRHHRISIGMVAVALVAGGLLAGVGRVALLHRTTSVVSNVDLTGLVQRNRMISSVHRGITALVRYFEEGKQK